MSQYIIDYNFMLSLFREFIHRMIEQVVSSGQTSLLFLIRVSSVAAYSVIGISSCRPLNSYMLIVTVFAHSLSIIERLCLYEEQVSRRISQHTTSISFTCVQRKEECES